MDQLEEAAGTIIGPLVVLFIVQPVLLTGHV